MESDVWNFRGFVRSGTTPQHLTTVQVAEQGMYVQTSTDGLITFTPPIFPADGLIVTLTNIATPRIALLWSDASLQDGEYYQQNIELPSGSSQRAIVDLTSIDAWNGNPSMIALAFPAGAEVLIESIEWNSYNPAEKLWNAFRSFWTPDTFKLYSINFLWGPLIGFTPEARETLYETLPPSAWSATRMFYGVFIAAAIVALGLRLSKTIVGTKRARTILIGTGVALWILFDARMTMEIVRYAANDWSSYVLKPTSDRVLRTHSGLYGILDRIDALLGDDRQYVLLTKEGTPFFANVRYRLYPSRPTTMNDSNGTKAWIVLGMPDISVKDGVITASDGTPLSPKGTVAERFDNTSFFFRVP